MYNNQEFIEALKGKSKRARDQALEWLYKDITISKKISKWLKYNNVNSVEVQDILQISILDLYHNILNDKFDGRSSVKTYFLSICRFKILSEKKGKNKPELLEDLKPLEKQSKTSVINFELQERRKVLLELLGQIGTKCKIGMILLYFFNESMETIAEALELANANQARKLVSRCRSKLRTLIENDPRFDDLHSDFILFKNQTT